ncbi:hypothetical protein [Xenorhabdus sp. KK7.4]|uniref:hypothetical protein n=1 Tax=Xenorhabdus sp. KK7.4 TaxID=1851572 RepID=UPI000C04FCCA|nr:hypothetical protein [Xenorhabdus sp. KK7.4]PHM52115.1 hypothetical protein Xekk_03340 [Xenorhabdus sp. KK7.4]
MNNEFSEILGYVLGGIFFIGWLTAIIFDALHKEITLMISDIVMFPFGIIRGIGMWFGIN